jgi:deoxyribonuclease V
MDWPDSADRLVAEQRVLARAGSPPWHLPVEAFSTAGCFVCFPRRHPGMGARGDPAWAGAALLAADGSVSAVVRPGRAGWQYEAGLLALREGLLLEQAVRALPGTPEVVFVNATGRDHPRRAGLALHLGAVLALPSVGVTHRPLLSQGDWPEPVRGARSPLVLDDELVGFWLSTRDQTRPLAVHAGWRTDPETALDVVLRVTSGRTRTPEPIRLARHTARVARAEAERFR